MCRLCAYTKYAGFGVSYQILDDLLAQVQVQLTYDRLLRGWGLNLRNILRGDSQLSHAPTTLS